MLKQSSSADPAKGTEGIGKIALTWTVLDGRTLFATQYVLIFG